MSLHILIQAIGLTNCLSHFGDVLTCVLFMRLQLASMIRVAVLLTAVVLLLLLCVRLTLGSTALLVAVSVRT